MNVLQAFDLGFKEVQLQAWGRDQKELLAVASDIAAIDSRVSVKIPMTEAGANVAAGLKRQNALVTMTGMHAHLCKTVAHADHLSWFCGS